MELTLGLPLITSLGDVTPQWLTSVLRREGALLRGSVLDVAMDTASTSFCTTVRLRLTTVEPSGARLECLR